MPSASPGDAPRNRILILDFGSQTTQLIARRVRAQQIYCEIRPGDISAGEIRAWRPAGIILSGGPASVFAADAPQPDPEIFALELPMLGICYGLHLMARQYGGTVAPAASAGKSGGGGGEYGRAELRAVQKHPLFEGLGAAPRQVWMSHGDKLQQLPQGFHTIAESDASPFAAIAHNGKALVALQFHPEVMHSEGGEQMLTNFVRGMCNCTGNWTPAAFVERAVARVREQVGAGRALCGLSGGVDSAVAAAIVHRAIGENLQCIFVDHGMLRQGERAEVEAAFAKGQGIPLTTVDAGAQFLQALKGITAPEEKRRIIGRLFIEIFEAQAAKIPDANYLVQGTLYPDVIESVSVRGPAAVIKTHHNVGGLPEQMKLQLVEPLRELFKDEVREAGRQLGLPEMIISRHPFPGPGLAVRILGEVTRERCELLRAADAIFLEELRAANWYAKVWQAFAVFLPVRSVGVMGDDRSYENCIALRCVSSQDAMTADWSRLPHEVLARASNRITNEVRGVNRVVYDISSKPPATIEWE